MRYIIPILWLFELSYLDNYKSRAAKDLMYYETLEIDNVVALDVVLTCSQQYRFTAFGNVAILCYYIDEGFGK
jgi:hypothetical protein